MMKSNDRSESAKRPQRRMPVRCAKCFPYNAELLGKDGPKASRTQIRPAPVPKLGLNTLLLDEAIAAGPSGIRKAQHVALKFAKKYHEEAIDHFRKVTAFLQCWIDKGDSHYRARARFALVWRPRFLAALSMTNSVTLAARRARISRQAIYEHRKADAEFAKQWDEAVEHAIDMLHARAFQRALEGDLEPVYYMGEPVGYIRKFSDKLQIEMLRAYRPDRFRTPGTNVNIGTRGDVFVLTEEQRAELKAINRQWLLTAPIEGGDTVSPPSANDLHAQP